MRARGGMELDIEWKEGKLAGITLHSKLGGPCRVRYGSKEVEIKTLPGASYRLSGLLAVERREAV